MFAPTLALAVLQLAGAAPQSLPQGWERAFVAQIDSLADLRAAVEDSCFVDPSACCFIVPPHPQPLKATREPVARVAAPALEELARSGATSELRRTAAAAVATIRAPDRPRDLHSALLEAGWMDAADFLARLESALERPGAAPDMLRALEAAGRLASDDPLRHELARRRAADFEGARRWPRAHLIAAAAVARAWPSAADASLERDLFAALDTESDVTEVASVCLGVFASRAPEHEPLVSATRTALHARFDDPIPSHRRAAWIGAAFFGRGLSIAKRRDEGLSCELRARFDTSSDELDASAAALALGVLADRSTSAAIAARLLAAPLGSRGPMAMALGLLDASDGQEALEIVARAARAPSERLDAALALGLIEDKQLLTHWLLELSGAEPRAAHQLARVIAALGDVRAVDFLADELERRSDDPSTQLALVRALGAVGDPNSSERRLSSYYCGR